MLIKINGVPWENMPTPEPKSFMEIWSGDFPADMSWAETFSNGLEMQNDWNYWQLHHIPHGDDVYKFCGWAVEKAITFFTG